MAGLFTFIGKVPSFSVFFRSTFEVQPACMMLIRITFEHGTCKCTWVVFSVCSQPVLLGIEFHSAPGFYIHGNAWIASEVSGSFAKVLQSDLITLVCLQSMSRCHGNDASSSSFTCNGMLPNFLGLVPKQQAWFLPLHAERGKMSEFEWKHLTIDLFSYKHMHHLS